ncbi:hypothetical protein [Nonomuraea sp. NPDC049400]|uniref:hypothetical protein n=1 Tax=Nonomuraea sp. NPDC049400 TaxID=3364352 RepID=UPI0037AE6413
MPTREHEYLIELVRQRPSLVATLLTETGVSVPPFQEAQLGNADFNVFRPTEFRADSVVLLTKDGAPVSAVVLEVQREYDKRKRWSWPVYLATLRARQECPALLLVFCDNPETARKHMEPIDMGHPGWVLHPIVIGAGEVPVITDLGWAVEEPALAALSAIVHSRSESGFKVVQTLLYAVMRKPSEMRDYAEIALPCLPESMKVKVKEFVMTMAPESRSELLLEWVAEGEAQGKAKGEAKSILLFLEARGIPVPDQARIRITECTDLDTLEAWIRKAATAQSADDLF